MEQKILTEIHIEGKEVLHFSKLVIHQYFNAHHEFELNVNHDIFELLGSYKADRSRELIGKKLVIVLTDSITRNETRFAGIICEIALQQGHGFHGEVLLKGYSSSILLDSGPSLKSFKGKTLEEIAHKLSSGIAKNDINLAIKPEYRNTIPYITQYKESAYAFLNRLSAEYGEWFYYEADTLYFGKPDKQEEVQLVYGQDLHNLNWSMKVAPVSFGQYSYNSAQHQFNKSQAPDSVAGADDQTTFALARSQGLYADSFDLPVGPRIKNKKELDDLLKRRKAAAAADLVAIKGHSRNPGVNLGSIAHIEVSRKELLDFVKESYGSYLVTQVTHQIDGNNRYTNDFIAIPATTEVVPVKNAVYPVAESQVATVTANHDPEGQSRVQVKMLWQNDGEATDWIRVLQPDAGSGDVKGNNRGFFVIPEIDDQVIVGFRYNDPNRPFVMGSIYHSQNTDSSPQANNHLKSMSTRSGHVIEFDDSKGSQGITITDQNNNVIHIDTQGNNITISALETMTFNAKNMKFNVQENMDVAVGKNKKEIISEDFDFQAKNLKSTVVENSDQVTGKKLQHIAGEMTMHSNQGKILIDGTGKVTLQSKDRIDYGE
ncbi:type VI secretion system Vgr family protein [Pedobacter cryoconitis]|uniref:Uncharacterized protein involved in type VI secretion and phage assembly n=1 Tax=Pedobacter cryoconitis TaxID=188932 RepID=A0A327T746_9SPHI|nr:phage baseplate assembly protein V [Pedobacter cryoconitis]RAJ37159.1 uncharacterized protein involved in type VI secretion and phage assembly [Pedobacter cryoconitis]